MGPAGWVFDYDAIFEILFALITFGIGLFSLKIHSFTKERSQRNFGLAFISISISYWILAALNLGAAYFVTLWLNLETYGVMRLLLSSHMGFYIIGVLALGYTTLKIRSDQTYYMLLLITFLSIVAATQKLFLFYSISSVLFAYVSFYYLMNYKKKKNLNSLLVLTGFIFLLLANVSLIFSVQNSYYYTVGHVLHLLGYCLLFINLARVLRK